MKQIRAIMIVTALMLFGMGTAHANMMGGNVAVNYTGDNLVFLGTCTDITCTTTTSLQMPPNTAPNAFNWRLSDTSYVSLGRGTHYFKFQIVNAGTPSSTNPAALLADIVWDGGSRINVSSSAWDVSTTGNLGTWVSATEYAQNGSGIWGAILGGPVAGISTSANWIYTASQNDQQAFIRTSITVPEPASLALLGLGLAGLGLVRRRSVA